MKKIRCSPTIDELPGIVEKISLRRKVADSLGIFSEKRGGDFFVFADGISTLMFVELGQENFNRGEIVIDGRLRGVKGNDFRRDRKQRDRRIGC